MSPLTEEARQARPQQAAERAPAEQHRRAVRSYVLRAGRLTAGQKRALEDLWPRYGIAAEAGTGTLDFASLFGNRNPVILEIGFGNGDATWCMARSNPAQNYLGAEVHRPGVGHLLMKLEQEGITNVRVACADAAELLRERIADESLAGVLIFFPDPWPKKRQHKRRIVQQSLVGLLARRLCPGGMLHLATDWKPYAEQMLEVIGADRRFRNVAGAGRFAERPAWRPETRFEQRGVRLGHQVHDLLFERVA